MSDDNAESRFIQAAMTDFFEAEEWVAALEKAAQCSDPGQRRSEVAHLMEERVLRDAKLAEEILAAADAGVVDISDKGRRIQLGCSSSARAWSIWS